MRSNAYDFAKEIETRIEALSKEQYHTRSRPAKRLIEELYPLSRLALALKKPGQDVDVEAFEDSGRADGHIWISGFLEMDFEVQVTYAAYEEADALRSRLLVEQGFAPGAGPITLDRRTGKITATMEVQDMDAPINRLADSISKRVRAKTANDSYVSGTVLLVAFDEIKLRGRGWWSLLYSAIDDAGGLQSGMFSQVFLFNGCSNELQQVA